MATPDRICDKCHKIWHVEGAFCPDDGGKLQTIDDPNALIGRVIDEKLTLTGVLGKGGMGVVYRANQHSMDREVAVKILNPTFSRDAESVKRFLQEAKAASRLDHPNIITVFDFGRTDDGLLYLVMELMIGRDLGAEIEEHTLTPSRMVHILSQVCDAVHHAHERGLVHRDLKPENIYLLDGSARRGDFVKVLDFGIAMAAAHEGVERITKTGTVCGTPAYMSPEQVLGDEVDGRSDVYSLGIVAFEALTGAHPFPADTPMRQLLAQLEAPLPTFAELEADPTLPPTLEVVVRHALEKERERRTPSALAFADELVSAIQGANTMQGRIPDPVALPGKEPPGKRRTTKNARAANRLGFADTAISTDAVVSPSKRGPARLALIALVAALVVVAAVFALSSSSSHDTTTAAPTAQADPEPAPAAPVEAALTPPPEDPGPVEVEAAAADAESPAATLDPTTPELAVAEAAAEADIVAPAAVPADEDVVAEDVAPEALPPEPVRVTVGPGKVNVWVDGALESQRPIVITRPSGDDTLPLKVTRVGYVPQTVTVAHDSEDISGTLKRSRPAATKPATKPTTTTPPSDGAKTGGGLIE